MLAAYMDESRDNGRGGVFAVAGFVGNGWDWLSAERDWDGLLRKHRLRSFKASNHRRLIGEFLEIPARNHLLAFGVAVRQQDFYEVVGTRSALRPFSESPYWLAYHQAIVQTIHDLKMIAESETVAFVADEHSKYGPRAASAYSALAMKNPITATSMGSFHMRDDTLCLPLQMADLLAAEVRQQAQHWRTEGMAERESLRKLRDADCMLRCTVADSEWLSAVLAGQCQHTE